jgi:hypothetical protein
MAYAGSIASRGNPADILKPIFDDQARDIIQTEFPFWKYIKQADGEKVKLNGDYFEIECLVSRNDSSANIAELGDLPVATQPVFKKGTLKPVRVFQPIQIGHEIMMLADSDTASYATKLEMLFDDARAALSMNLNRQALGDGTGILATITGNVTGGSATATVAVDDTKFFEEKQKLDIWNGAAETNVTMRNTAPVRFVVDSIDSATQITVSMSDGSNVPAGVVTNDVIIRAESAYVDTTRKTYEMNGIQSITAPTAGFMGLTARRWAATRYNANSQAIGPRLLARAEIAKRRNSPNGGKLTTLWMSPEQALEIVYGGNGTYPDVRFSREDAAKASVKGQNKPKINFDGRDIEVSTDLMFPVTKAIAFTDEALMVGMLHDVQFEKFDGRESLPAFNPTTGRYVAADNYWLGARLNLGCFARNEFVEVYGLPTPAA